MIKFLLCILAIYPARGSVDELAPFIPYMSEDLYYSIFKDNNETGFSLGKGHKFLSKRDIDSFRRFGVWSVNVFWPFAYYDEDTNRKACAGVRYIYRGSLDYIYRYYNIRALYHDTWEYDVGYLCHQIIYRYQIMIETYHIVIKKFVKDPDRRILTIPPFFYFYTNMIEQSQLIFEYVHMLEESEAKYRGITNMHWVDLSTRSRVKKKGYYKDMDDATAGGDADDEDDDPAKIGPNAPPDKDDKVAAAYERQRIAMLLQKKRERKIKKKLAKKGKLQLIKSTYTRRKNTTGFWWFDYGWSIEGWPPK
ncbi:uncharacterized protein LOC128682156 [Plodia interpunctella]|uniref:uncharacterized protein LOC128682156 n=1 Tax=Plodia interpunctella TaxID=58824 RepID=UPI0023680CF0|nr:uncharacterized protein LOC128682156 [Plodia interpunctella]